MSPFRQIADAVATVITSISGAPATVEVRKDDAFRSRETLPLAIVTMGAARKILAVSGEGSSTNQGDVCYAYEIGVTIYRDNRADLSTNLDAQPDYVHRCKQALAKKTLAGAPTVYGSQIVDDPSAWEHQPFGDGHEVSRFGAIFLSAETRLGD